MKRKCVRVCEMCKIVRACKRQSWCFLDNAREARLRSSKKCSEKGQLIYWWKDAEDATAKQKTTLKEGL